MKDKVLVYDSTSGYKRFIRMHFGNEFDCESFFEYRGKKNINYGEFIAVFIIVNDPMDLVDVLTIHKKVGLIFLGSPIVKISESLKELDDMVFIDLQQNRSDMMRFIKYNLRILGVYKDLQ